MGYLPFFSARAGYFGVCRGNRWDTARAGPAHHISACWDGTPPVWDNVNAMAMRAAVCNGRAEVRAGWDKSWFKYGGAGWCRIGSILKIRFIDFLRFTLLQIGGLSGSRHFG